MIGKQVFKLFNAIYHEKRALVAYSNYIVFKNDFQVGIGMSKDYESKIKKNNSYRDHIAGYHPYSHLKSFKADLFLHTRADSYQDKQGNWYTNTADNAYMFAVL